jgi:hypothetical protein
MAPILVVGSPRSGTTAITLGLSAAGISGYSEGHFLMLFVRIEQAITKYYRDEAKNNVPGTLLHALPMGQIVEDYRRMARLAMDAAHGGNAWFDKTAHGGMIGCLPFMRALWPDAKIIFAKRRPMENIESRLKKFPHMSFAEHCSDLKYILNTWAIMRETLDNWLEIDQYDLITEPVKTAKTVSRFLKFDSGAEGAFLGTILNTHPERTASSYTPRRFSELNWPQTHKSDFAADFDALMKQFGYDYENYYAREGASTGARAFRSHREADADLEAESALGRT